MFKTEPPGVPPWSTYNHHLPTQFGYLFCWRSAILSILVRLKQEILLLVLQINQLKRDLRAEDRQRLFGDPIRMIPESMYIASWRAHIQAFHQLMYGSQHIWRTQFPRYWTWLSGRKPLPERVFAWVASADDSKTTRMLSAADTLQSYMLFRACLIYAHTSMFPNKMKDPSPDFDISEDLCASAVYTRNHLLKDPPNSFLFTPVDVNLLTSSSTR